MLREAHFVCTVHQSESVIALALVFGRVYRKPLRIEDQLETRSAVMAKTISCRDVGVDCDFKASGESTEEVLQKCAQHAKDAHGMETIPPDLASKVQAAIRDE